MEKLARPTSRRETGANTSSTRNGSARRDTSVRVSIPEVLHHDRHLNEERGNESRSRARSGQSRNARQSGHYLHHFIPSYPFFGNLINSGEIDLEEFLDLLPDIWGYITIFFNNFAKWFFFILSLSFRNLLEVVLRQIRTTTWFVINNWS